MKLLIPCLLIAGVTCMTPVYADETSHNLAAVDQHITPGYQRLAAATGKLDAAASQFCINPSAGGLTQVQLSYKSSMAAWQSIQHVRFGPVDFYLRLHRYQLWPDKRGEVGKGLAKLLASKDTQVLEPEKFKDASVALQGFSALERLLYEADVTAKDFAAGNAPAFRCAVLQAITGNLKTMSVGVRDEWTQGDAAYRKVIATAALGNAYYESESDVTATLLKSLHTQLQIIADQKLGLPLDPSSAKAKGRRAETWLSAGSLDNIANNLTALQDLYSQTFSPRIAQLPLDGQIEKGFETSLKLCAKVGMPLDKAVSDPHARQQVEELRAAVVALRELFANALPRELGVPLGFNSLDGD
jgi:predicted lipoprotein